ncbi:MAG: ABC transporter permease [Bacteroidia bacterium]|nr:ABC transporter permease [Bacteroidia bacterium]
MNLSLFIAKRYFFSKKSQRAINIISMIAVGGVAIGTAALIIVLSVFNGFEDLVMKMYNAFDPDITITAANGKSFHENSIDPEKIKGVDGVKYITPVIEENALIKYGDKQYIVTIKGVGSSFEKMTGIDSLIVEGKYLLEKGDTDFAVLGGGIAYNLNVNLNDVFSQLEIYAPKKMPGSLLNPEEAFNRRFIPAAGIFSVQQDFDMKYVLVPIRFAREILDYDSSLTAIEIGLFPGADMEKVQKNIAEIAGSQFTIKNRLQLHEILYRIMRSEKWAVFLILTFILIIATFSIISSITMLIIEKKQDIGILHSLGADVPLLRKIFLTEGFFITIIGAATGLLLGFIICLIQMKTGIIPLTGGSFVVDSYPVQLKLPDFIYILCTVSLIGFLTAWYPGRKLIRRSVVLQGIRGKE